jgi:hypothetical protein
MLLHFIIHPFVTQTVTSLDLSSNQIGDRGAQDLANALQINKVTPISFFASRHHSPTFHTDTHHTRPLLQSNQCQWKRTSCENIQKYYTAESIVMISVKTNNLIERRNTF